MKAKFQGLFITRTNNVRKVHFHIHTLSLHADVPSYDTLYMSVHLYPEIFSLLRMTRIFAKLCQFIIFVDLPFNFNFFQNPVCGVK